MRCSQLLNCPQLLDKICSYFSESPKIASTFMSTNTFLMCACMTLKQSLLSNYAILHHAYNIKMKHLINFILFVAEIYLKKAQWEYKRRRGRFHTAFGLGSRDMFWY